MDNNKTVDHIDNKIPNVEERSRTPNSETSDSSFHSITEDLNNLEVKEEFENTIKVSNDDLGNAPHSNTLNKDESKDNLQPQDSFDKDDDTDEEDLYFVDEEHLKDQELDLTEEDKNKRQLEALSHKESGNNLFKESKYSESALSYTAGLRICPLHYNKDRAILYANRGAARAMMDEKKPAIHDCSKAIELNEHYLKAILRRARLYEETESLDDALVDFKRVLELDHSNSEARLAVIRLPPLIEARNEKLKTEMLGKLKDLGNVFLRPFGLSTNNFNLNQDPNTGGYNIQFNQNQS